MASNAFGSCFRMTTWGESHGPAMGVVLDGCPAGLVLDVSEVQKALDARAPGRQWGTSPRQEPDRVRVLSGCVDGVTTGAPLSMLIENQDADPSAYDTLKGVLRPGHATATTHAKFGVYDHRGGGRASARETVCRVAAGAVAEQLLSMWGIYCGAVLVEVGPVMADVDMTATTLSAMAEACQSHVWPCPDPVALEAMQSLLKNAQEEGDSWGGVVAFRAEGMPPGLGEPVYDKLDACLAHAMLSIPASKGFELGHGFAAAAMRGSEHNDPFVKPMQNKDLGLGSNQAGGLLGGMTTGQPLWGRVAFKPTSSIRQPQSTHRVDGEPVTMTLSANSRHDPCVAIRAVPVVKAMLALVLVDAVLRHRLSRVDDSLRGGNDSPCSGE